MEEIRSWFEVPAIAHYCYLFRAAFDLTEFEIEDFEDALVVDGSSEGTSFIPDLLARLLRGLYRTKDVTSQNYERYLNDLLDYHYVYLEKKDNPVKDIPFKNLPTKKKVEVLYDICHWRLEVDDIQELLKNNEPEQIRVQPIGKDSKGALYWYFYGNCLYKEEPLEKPVPILNGMLEESGRHKMKGKKRKKKGKGRKLKSAKKKKKDKWYSGSETEESDDSYSPSSDDDSMSYKKAKKQVEEGSDSMSDVCKPYQCHTKWALACSSTKEWEELADSFKGSKHKGEKQLHQLLVEDYIEEIPKIIEAKERALQRKLMQEAPRRASDRIAYKLQQQEEEERIRYLIMQEEEDKRQKEAEEKRKYVEEQRKKERDERAKERERIAEERRIERERRAKQREEQKWAIENPELANELKKVVEDSQRAQHDRISKRLKTDNAERDEDEYTAMFKVIDVLKKHKDAWPFLEPVDESYAPQYYDIIETPMDLAKVEEKLEKSQYTSKDEFIKDVELMFANCLEYNGEESCYTKMANSLDRMFRKQLLKEFPEDTNDSNDEDYLDDSDDPKKKKKVKKKKGEMYTEAESTPVKSEPQLPHVSLQDGKRLFPQMPHIGTSNGMFPGPGIRAVNPGGPMIPSDVVRAQVMQQQIRLLTAMNGVLRPGATVMPQLRPAADGPPATFPRGLSPHLAQLGGPMASLIGQFTRMPLAGNKNMPVNPHQLGERPANPGNIPFAQAPMFQGMIPSVGRLDASQLQGPPRFRMIFPPQAEAGAPNPRAFSLDQLLARSTPAEKPSSTTSTIKTTHLASSQPSVRLKKEDEKNDTTAPVAEEEKENPLTRKVSLEESNARVQSWLDSQPEAFEQDQPETPTTKEPPAPTRNPISSPVVSSMGAAAAVAASIHNAVRQSMRGTEKQEASPASHTGSVLYKKNGFVNLAKQTSDSSGRTSQGLLIKEPQDKAADGAGKETNNTSTSKPQFFMYQEGKQPASLLSPQIHRDVSVPGQPKDDHKTEAVNPSTAPNTTSQTSSAQPLANAGLAKGSPKPDSGINMPSNNLRPQQAMVRLPMGAAHLGANFLRAGSPGVGLTKNQMPSPQNGVQPVIQQKQDPRQFQRLPGHPFLMQSNSPRRSNSSSPIVDQRPPQIPPTLEEKHNVNAALQNPVVSQQSVITSSHHVTPVSAARIKTESKSESKKEPKEKKPRKPRQKKKGAPPEIPQMPVSAAMGMPQLHDMDRQRNTAVQNEVQNILAQSAQMAGIGQLIVNQGNQHPRGMPFLTDMSKTDSLTLGMTRAVQLPGTNQTFLMQVPVSQKASGEQEPGQGGRLIFPGQQGAPVSAIQLSSSQPAPFMTNPFMVVPSSNFDPSMGTPSSVGRVNVPGQGQPSQLDSVTSSHGPSLSNAKAVQSPSIRFNPRNPQMNIRMPIDSAQFAAMMDTSQTTNPTRPNNPNGNSVNRTLPGSETKGHTPVQNVPIFLQGGQAVTMFESRSTPNRPRTDATPVESHPPGLHSRPDQSFNIQNIVPSTRGTVPQDVRNPSNSVQFIASPMLAQQRGALLGLSNPNQNSPVHMGQAISSPSSSAPMRRGNPGNREMNRHSNSPFQASGRSNSSFPPQYSHPQAVGSPSNPKAGDVVPKAVTDRPKFLDLSKPVHGKMEPQRPDVLINNENRNRVNDLAQEKTSNGNAADTKRGSMVSNDNRNIGFNMAAKRNVDEKNSHDSRTPPQLHSINVGQGTRAFTLGTSIGSLGGTSLPFGLPFTAVGMDSRPQFSGSNVPQDQTRYMEEMMHRRYVDHQRMLALSTFQAGQGPFEEGAKRNSFHQL